MSQEAILYPVFVLVALTFFVGLWLARLRFRAVGRGELSPTYFALNRGAKVPEYLAKVTHNYDNLLELPILFYAVTVLLYAGGRVDVGYVALAWVFVISRLVHTYIHTTYNHVFHRLLAFGTGVALLLVMWMRLVIDIVVG